MFTQKGNASSKQTARPRKLHSLHGLLIGREFIGEIETGKTKQKFAYAPKSVAMVNQRIEIRGSFSVTTAGRTRKAENVKAKLLSTQGSLTAAPAPPMGADESMLGTRPSVGLPETDATGYRGIIGVIYFKLSALDGRTLGVAADMNDVQLNGRLNPGDEMARALQFWFSVAVQAVHGESPDGNLATKSIDEINRILKV